MPSLITPPPFRPPKVFPRPLTRGRAAKRIRRGADRRPASSLWFRFGRGSGIGEESRPACYYFMVSNSVPAVSRPAAQNHGRLSGPEEPCLKATRRRTRRTDPLASAAAVEAVLEE